jgi:hypothetical protein
MVLVSLTVLSSLHVATQETQLPGLLLLRSATNAHHVAMMQEAAISRLTVVVAASLAAGPENEQAFAPLNGETFTIRVLGEPMTVRLQSAGGLIDINTANPSLIGRAFRAADIQGAVASILERRAQRAFASVEDAERFVEATTGARTRLSDWHTVRSRDWGVYPAYAPPAVLRLLGSPPDPDLVSWSAGSIVEVEFVYR